MDKDDTQTLPLGAFSVSLAVADLEASRAFYENLGFSAVGGDASQNWLIVRNGTTTLGLFQGMFDRNILTFNPGWDASGNALDHFTDVRTLQARLEERGVALQTRVADGTRGPACLVAVDPDGNPVMLDQHV